MPKDERRKQQLSETTYSSAVGSLMYAMICTRPNIAYAIGLVSKFKSNLGMAHWRGAIKMFSGYLKWTIIYSLCYQGERTNSLSYIRMLIGLVTLMEENQHWDMHSY